MPSLPHDPAAEQLAPDLVLGCGAAATDAPGDHPFDRLQRLAEAATAGRSMARRPTWAPMLVLGGELLENLIALVMVRETDEPIARLWANFADPCADGRAASRHSCRGFELHIGESRDGELIWRTPKAASGEWECGPQPSVTSIDSATTSLERTRDNLMRALDAAERTMDSSSQAYARRIDELDACYTPELERWSERLDEVSARYALLCRVGELAGERVAVFADKAGRHEDHGGVEPA